MSDNPLKVQYALGLLTSLEEMREGNIICDFTIKVGGDSFPVHRTILAASSKYFRALIESGMIEVQQGFIDMKGITAKAVAICIKYIYSGDAKIVLELAESTIEAAHLMQIDGLVDSCFIFLRNNISASNCVSVIALSRRYGRLDVESLAEKYLSENLAAVSSTESFSSISKDDFIRYVNASTCSYKVLWQALSSWVHTKDDDQLILEMMETVKFKDFPFKFLFQIIQTDSLVKNSQALRDRMLRAMFSREAKSNLTIDNVFTLASFIRKSLIFEKSQILEQIKDFMLQNFEDLIDNKEFVDLDESDILMFLSSPKVKCSSEEIKWKAILNWISRSRRRRKSFSKLFKLLQLEKLSKEFIRDNIRVEPMVKESTECMDLIVQVALDQTTVRGDKKEGSGNRVALLDSENGGIVRVFDTNDAELSILSRLKGTASELNAFPVRGITSCDGELYIMANEGIFKFGRNKKWIRLRPMPIDCEWWPEVTCWQSRIYVLIGGEIMACSNPVENDWALDLPGYGVDPTFCVVSCGVGLIALGGERGGKPTNEVKEYDAKKRTWRKMTPMLKERSGPSAAMLSKMIIVTGGRDQNAIILDSVECYTPFTRSWSMFARMNTPRDFHMFVVSNKVYVCGCDRHRNGALKDMGTIECFDEEDAGWKTVAEATFLRFIVPACEYQ